MIEEVVAKFELFATGRMQGDGWKNLAELEERYRCISGYAGLLELPLPSEGPCALVRLGASYVLKNRRAVVSFDLHRGDVTQGVLTTQGVQGRGYVDAFKLAACCTPPNREGLPIVGEANHLLANSVWIILAKDALQMSAEVIREAGGLGVGVIAVGPQRTSIVVEAYHSDGVYSDPGKTE